LKSEHNSLSSPKGELTSCNIPPMAYQFVREPLRPEEADKLCNACKTMDEKLVVWTLLDTGLRVSELCGLTPSHVLWQQKSLRVSGKGGPYGKRSKKRVVPMSRRIQALLEPYFALNEKWFIGKRQAQKIVKRVAERARISQDVTPHVLRHTFATTALQKGISLAAIQKILGHDRLATTAIYLNLTDIHVVEEYSQKW
jgi:integrase/recombinase XerD